MNIQCKTLEDTKDVINIRKPKKVKRTKIIFITLHKQTKHNVNDYEYEN